MYKKILMFLFLMIMYGTIQGQDGNLSYCDNLIKNGVSLLNKGKYTQSLELLIEAKSLATENKWDKQQFLAFNNIGANYYSLFDYGEALNNYLKAYSIAIHELSSKYEIIVLNNIAILYSKEKKYGKSYEYFNKAYKIAIENKEVKKKGL